MTVAQTLRVEEYCLKTLRYALNAVIECVEAVESVKRWEKSLMS